MTPSRMWGGSRTLNKKTRSVCLRLSCGAHTDVAREAELGLFTAELRATLALLDSGSVPVQDALEGLQQWTGSDGVQPFLQDRARWMSALLGRPSPLHAGHFELKLFLEADSLAAAGQPSIALILL